MFEVDVFNTEQLGAILSYLVENRGPLSWVTGRGDVLTPQRPDPPKHRRCRGRPLDPRDVAGPED